MDSLLSFPVGLFHSLQHAGFDPGAPPLDVKTPLRWTSSDLQNDQLRVRLCNRQERRTTDDQYVPQRIPWVRSTTPVGILGKGSRARLAQHFIRATLQYGISAMLHEDNRYFAIKAPPLRVANRNR